MAFYFENTEKDIFTTEQVKEDFDNNIVCRFSEKEIFIDKLRGHCRLTGKIRGPAHSKCKINVAQSQSSFIPIVFHNFINYDCHLVFKKTVDKKRIKLNS